MTHKMNANLWYVAFISALFAAALASWNSGVLNRWDQLLWILGGAITALVITLLVDARIQQARWLYTSLTAAAFGVVFVVASLVIGSPILTVCLYLLVGCLVGSLLGWLGTVLKIPGFIYPLGLLVSLGASNPLVWSGLNFSLESLWVLIAALVSIALIASLLAPGQDAVVTYRTCAILLVLGAIWITPLVDLVRVRDGQISILTWVWEIALSIFGIVLAGSWARSLWDRFHLARYARQTLFTRQIAGLLSNSDASIKAFQKTYADVSPEMRQLIFRADMIKRYPLAFAQFIQNPHTLIGKDTMQTLPPLFQKADAALRAVLIDIFTAGIENHQSQIWEPCLQKLMQMQSSAAIEVCCQKVIQGNMAPMRACLKGLSTDKDYASGLDALTKAFPKIPTNQQRPVVDLIFEEIRNSSEKRSDIALRSVQKQVALHSIFIELLQTSFHQETQSKDSKTLQYMNKISPNLIVAEARWVAEQGHQNHLIALLQHESDELILQILSNFVAMLQSGALQGRADGLCTWLGETLPAKSPRRSAGILLAMSHIHPKKTLAYLQTRGRSLPVDILKQALGPKQSALRPLYWQWIKEGSYQQAQDGVQVLDRIAG